MASKVSDRRFSFLRLINPHTYCMMVRCVFLPY
jgi:hypothetical protein